MKVSPAANPLIPGLPDDLALYCLTRLPLAFHSVGKTVCRSWYSILSSSEVYRLRRSLGLAEAWLFVLAFHRSTGRVQWQSLDPVRKLWRVIPAMPCKGKVCPPGFGCAAITEQGKLFVCGGMLSDMDCPLDSVLKYDMHSDRWSIMGRMSTPRSFFASGMIDGRIYAAGGNSTDPYELSSAEVYNPVEDQWQPVADMGTNIARYDAAVLNGKLYVTEGWLWPFLLVPRGQVYDPKLDKWENMSVGMREGWRGLSVVLDNHLFVISDHSSKLKMYDMETDNWNTVGGSPLPSHLVRPFSVNALNGKVFVVARCLHVAVGTVSHVLNEDGIKITIVEWQIINAPEMFYDFTPSNSQVLLA
eukprot:c28309_g1_i1 orf=333-1409(-)